MAMTEQKKQHISLPGISGTIILILVTIICTWFFTWYFTPKHAPKVNTEISWNTGVSKQNYDTPFRIALKPDLESWIKVAFVNNGDDKDEDLEVQLSLKNNNNIAKVNTEYNPELLEKRVVSNKTKNRFYEKISSLPCDAGIKHKFWVKDFIKSEQDFQSSIVSKNHNWTQKIVLHPQSSVMLQIFSTMAHADEKKGEVLVDCQYLPHYGSTMDGYYHVTIAYGLRSLIISKGLITTKESKTISGILTSEKSAKLIMDGIPVLEFAQAVLNALISNGYITRSQAQAAIDNSSKGGYISVDGYDPVILQFEILRILYANHVITLNEGQAVIDCAKQK